MNAGLIIDLSNQKVSDVGARDDPVTPLRRLAQGLVPPGSLSVGQDPGPCNRPLERTVFDQPFLLGLVRVGASEHDLEWQALEAADAGAAVTGPETSDADQPLQGLGSHGTQQNTGRVREKVDWPEKISQ